MLTIMFRTIFIYILLTTIMRLMGKRQIGQLEVSDLVTTFLISEIASFPITDPSIPLSHAIVPIVVLLTLEVSIAMILSRSPKLKNILSARPTTLIKDGEILQKNMRDSRLSFDELMGDLRYQGVDDISQIKYAILEQNGKITIIQKARYRQPTAEQLHLKPKESGLFHIVIDQGCINKHGLSMSGMSKRSLLSLLSKKGLRTKDIYVLAINDAGEIKIVKKEQQK